LVFSAQKEKTEGIEREKEREIKIVIKWMYEVKTNKTRRIHQQKE